MQRSSAPAGEVKLRAKSSKRRKQERLESARARAKELTEFRLTQDIAGGRAGRRFREPRDDMSLYSGVFGFEPGRIAKGPIRYWWKEHQYMLHWLPMRRRCARTRHWHAWQCYAFPCAACGFPNFADSPSTHDRSYPAFCWQDGSKDSALLRCGGCGAGVFDMVSP